MVKQENIPAVWRNTFRYTTLRQHLTFVMEYLGRKTGKKRRKEACHKEKVTDEANTAKF